MTRKEIGERIKRIRQMNKMTREELAEKAEVSVKFLYEVEMGRKGLSADSLLKIARILSCSCDYILTGETCDDNPKKQAENVLNGFDSKDIIYVTKMLELMQEMCNNK